MKHCILSAAVASSIFFAAVGSVDVSAFSVSDVSAKAAVIIDACSGNVIAGKNEDMTLPMASTTKIMSSLLLIESGDLDSKFKVDNDAIMVEGSSMGLRKDDIVTKRDLCYGMLLPSGNDAANETAVLLAGSPEKFAVMMNEKARDIGLKNTHFDNPHGLDSENHYTTASDMSVMARELLKHEEILEFTRIYEDYLKKNDGSSIWLVNTNKLVRFYEGVDGLKTGYTTTAGYCMTATAKKNEMRLLSVVMNAPSSDLRSKDTTNMLNYGFNSYKLNILYEKEKNLGQVKIEKAKKEKVDVYLKDDITMLSKINENQGEYNYNVIVNELKAPLSKNQSIGRVEVIDNEGNIVKEEDVIVKEDIEKANVFDLFNRIVAALSSGNLS